ncbi:MAG: histidinol-phosphate transaminase [Spirochaetales bacterium]|jgi:histidinol-phosphate aminotransferase|nr:histidinol-phosphate transaminase [Spirochaetales bacterium]
MLSSRMNNLTPYKAGEQPRDKSYIKLNTNENPYLPTESVTKYLNNVDVDKLRLYPDPTMTALRAELAGIHGLAPENIFAGNGSDEVLSFCFYAFFDKVIFPEFTYSFYPVYCDFYGIPYHRTPLREDYGIDLNKLLSMADDEAVIFANPNSPTGMYLEPHEIEAFLRDFPKEKIVVVDEAYIDFGGRSCVDLLKSYLNLVVVRTFSKCHSLAGLRLGYCMASPQLIESLFAVKDSFNSYPVSTLAQELGLHALRDADANRANINLIIETRAKVSKELSGTGWRVLPSKANFVFISKPGLSGEDVYSTLKTKGILVRYFASPGLNDFVRVTIGTGDQMDAFIHAAADLKA